MDSKLKESLQQLQSTIASGDPVDEELHGLLQKLDGDIQLLLEKRRARAGRSGIDHLRPGRAQPGIVGQVCSQASRKLEPALRELGEILANMGI